MNPFADRLTELIKESGKQQREIADDLNIDATKISHWKKKHFEPQIEHIILLAKYFKVSADYLLGLEDEYGNKINS